MCKIDENIILVQKIIFDLSSVSRRCRFNENKIVNKRTCNIAWGGGGYACLENTCMGELKFKKILKKEDGDHFKQLFIHILCFI